MADEPGASPPASSGPATRWLIMLVLAAVVSGYALLVVLTRDRWATTTAEQEYTVVTYQPLADPAPSAESLAQARDVVAARVAAPAAPGARVDLDDGDAGPAVITVAVPTNSVGSEQLGRLGATGQLAVRPVVRVVAGQWSQPPAPTTAPDPERLAKEKELRQSDVSALQPLALQLQASRCADEDALAGRDDPQLPLVTCGGTGEAFLLDPALITGDQVRDASSGYHERAGEDTVNIEFTDEAAETWADFTAANIGAQVAFTVDTWVVAAPRIVEEIAGDSIQIAGGFTAAQARMLAATLAGGALPYPLAVASSDTEVLTVQSYSTGWRIGMISSGVLVVLLIAGAALAVRRAAHAAEVTR